MLESQHGRPVGGLKQPQGLFDRRRGLVWHSAINVIFSPSIDKRSQQPNRAWRALLQRGRARVRIKVAYTPIGGSKTARRIHLTLIKR